jgi:hypothetical protein
MRSVLLLAATMVAVAGPALAAKKWEGPAVRVVLVAGPVAETAMAEQKVVPQQPFMLQRLDARKSVTLESDVVVKFWHRTARFAAGTQLFQASGADGFEVYCGAYDPGGIVRSGGDSKIQYACLQDLDNDGVFDKGYWTPNNPGSFLPVFGKVIAGPDIKVAFRPDTEADRYAFEIAIAQLGGGKGPMGAVVSFIQYVRRPGDAAWNSVLSITTTEMKDGGKETVTETIAAFIKVADMPKSQTLGGATFTVLSGDKAGATVRPESAATGERTLDIFDAY